MFVFANFDALRYRKTWPGTRIKDEDGEKNSSTNWKDEVPFFHGHPNLTAEDCVLRSDLGKTINSPTKSAVILTVMVFVMLLMNGVAILSNFSDGVGVFFGGGGAIALRTGSYRTGLLFGRGGRPCGGRGGGLLGVPALTERVFSSVAAASLVAGRGRTKKMRSSALRLPRRDWTLRVDGPLQVGPIGRVLSIPLKKVNRAPRPDARRLGVDVSIRRSEFRGHAGARNSFIAHGVALSARRANNPSVKMPPTTRVVRQQRRDADVFPSNHRLLSLLAIVASRSAASLSPL